MRRWSIGCVPQMISGSIRAGLAGGRTQAAWLTESFAPLEPRNIYGVTKLAAEQVCREIHAAHGLPIVVLRTSRFFPEADDMAHTIVQSDANTKANEVLFRRLTLADAVESHVVALARAAEIGHDTFLVSARTPFVAEECPQLIVDAPTVPAAPARASTCGCRASERPARPRSTSSPSWAA